MQEFKEQKYVEQIPRDIECIIGADIGGTNSNFGIFEVVNISSGFEFGKLSPPIIASNGHVHNELLSLVNSV